MTHSAKRARRKRLAQEAQQRKETPRPSHQMDPLNLSGTETDREEEEDDHKILFTARVRESEEIVISPTKAQEATDCDIVNMVKTLNGAIAAVSQDTARIQRAYQQLCTENMARDKALADLTAMVREYSSSPEAKRPYGRSPVTIRPHPTIQADVMDGEGYLHAADIGITWVGNETFLHGVKVVGPQFPRPVGPGPIMSTPYPQEDGEDRSNSSTMAQPPTPVTPVLVPDADGHVRRPSPEVRQGYRPAAPIQRFNNKSLNWSAWFRHFRAVADVHGWSKDQRALQLVSYLDETAMNVAQELGDNDLYNYDVLVKLLSDRFDPASRVSAFRSRYHGRSRRHHEVETYPEDEGELENIFAVGDRPPWNNRRPLEPSITPTLQQMFALARRMGYEMRPMAKLTDSNRPPPGNRSFSDQNRGFRPQTRTGREYSRIKCFSCGQFGYMPTT